VGERLGCGEEKLWIERLVTYRPRDVYTWVEGRSSGLHVALRGVHEQLRLADVRSIAEQIGRYPGGDWVLAVLRQCVSCPSDGLWQSADQKVKTILDFASLLFQLRLECASASKLGRELLHGQLVYPTRELLYTHDRERLLLASRR